MDDGSLNESFDSHNVARLPVRESSISANGDDVGLAPGASLDEESPATNMLPVPPERTLKEKLVERERQKRIETERARLKRQFALSNDGAMEECLVEAGKEDGSVVGTVGGGSSFAAGPSDMNEEKQSERFGYAMERFLSESGQAVVQKGDLDVNTQSDPGGVVMERFLAEPVVMSEIVAEEPDMIDDPLAGHHLLGIPSESLTVERPQTPVSAPFQDSNVVHRRPDDVLHAEHGLSEEHDNVSLSTTDDVHHDHHHHLTANDSMDVNSHSAVEIGILSDLDRFSGQRMSLINGGQPTNGSLGQEASSSVSSLQSVDPSNRFLRLTEREIQEMEAIEEASIGNAPPSDREDTLSEVGDMVGFFPDPIVRAMDYHGSFSVNTHTTASVSNTSVGGNHSVGRSHGGVPADASSIDDIVTASVSSNLELSPGSSEGGASVTANPPSIATENDTVDEMISPSRDNPHRSMQLVVAEDALPHIPIFDHHDNLLDAEASARLNAGVANRRLRPGMEATPPRGLPKINAPETTEMKRAISMPEKMHISVDGFDYDKYDFILATPHSFGDSFQDLPGDSSWGQGDATMKEPPVNPRRLDQFPTDSTDSADDARQGRDLSPVFRSKYGAVEHGSIPEQMGINHFHGSSNDAEFSDRAPLLSSDIPFGRRSIAETVFSSLRSTSSTSNRERINDAHRYKASDILARAFPERFVALVVTLIVEIPVLFMISGGSDRLCALIGRRRYQLLLAFLPLSSAISGNCGLQASTLTTRAISHEDVTVENFREWLKAEIGVATYLGIGMGILLGTFGYILSGYDVSFGVTIFIAQFISLVTAGFSGTMAPLIFTYIFRRDSGKWGGQLETAIQDIFGSFAMVVVSYHVLLFLGPHPVAPTDVCGDQEF